MCMNKIFRYMLSFFLPVCSVAMGYAQSDVLRAFADRQIATEIGQQPVLRFKDVAGHWCGDTLGLSYQLEVIGRLIGRGEALHVVPVYEVSDKQYFMPEVLIQDRVRDSYYRREIELMSKEEYLATRPYQVVVLDGDRTDQEVNYHSSLYIPQASKGEGQLKIYQILEDCCDLQELGSNVVGVSYRDEQMIAPEEPATIPKLYLTPADLMFYRPKAEEVKLRAEQMSVRVQFKVARHEILPTFGNNAAELNRVREFLQPLLYGKSGDIEVTEASIKGYASPEGGFDYNQKLSERRALSFKSYLQTHYGGLRGLTSFPAIGMGEDWEGLRQALSETSSVPMRDEMIAIIDHVDIFSGREKQLMDLGGGAPYRYILAYLYPPLRRMEMKVGYRVRGYLPGEVEAIFDSRPQDLSQAEIYEVAIRRNDEHTPLRQYGKEFDVAADFFPDDLIANLNASSAALIRGEYRLAWRYLQRIQETPEASLNLAIYHWQTGDRDKVLYHLEQALQVPRLADKARSLLRQLK